MTAGPVGVSFDTSASYISLGKAARSSDFLALRKEYYYDMGVTCEISEGNAMAEMATDPRHNHLVYPADRRPWIHLRGRT